jgi:hypothetical protein
LPLAALSEAGAEVYGKINEQVEASTEVAQVVAALEQQYDAFVAAQENRSLLARDDELPSGDELGAEFERFLAQQTGDKFKDDKYKDDRYRDDLYREDRQSDDPDDTDPDHP